MSGEETVVVVEEEESAGLETVGGEGPVVAEEAGSVGSETMHVDVEESVALNDRGSMALDEEESLRVFLTPVVRERERAGEQARSAGEAGGDVGTAPLEA